MAVGLDDVFPLAVGQMRLRFRPIQAGALDDVAQARFGIGVHAFEEGRSHEGAQQLRAPALPHRPGIDRVAALHRLADGIVEAPPIHPCGTRFPRRIREDVHALGAGGRHAAHHHRQHRLHPQLHAGVLGEFDGLIEGDGGVGAADGRKELQDEGTVIRTFGRGHGRARCQQVCIHQFLGAEVGKPLLQVIEAIHAPIPLPAVVEHRAAVVSELFAAGSAGFESPPHGLGIGELASRRCRLHRFLRTLPRRLANLRCQLSEIRAVDARQRTQRDVYQFALRHILRRKSKTVVGRDANRVVAGKSGEHIWFRRIGTARSGHQMADQLDVVPFQQRHQELRRQMAVAVGDLVEVLHHMGAAGLAASLLHLGAAAIDGLLACDAPHYLGDRPAHKRRWVGG